MYTYYHLNTRQPITRVVYHARTNTFFFYCNNNEVALVPGQGNAQPGSSYRAVWGLVEDWPINPASSNAGYTTYCAPQLMLPKPVLKSVVTLPELTLALDYVTQRQAALATEARLLNEPAVRLYGAYLGYQQQPTNGAACWLVYEYERALYEQGA